MAAIDDIFDALMDWEDTYDEDSVGDNNIDFSTKQIIGREFVNIVNQELNFKNALLPKIGMAINYTITNSDEIGPVFNDSVFRLQRVKLYAEAIYNVFKQQNPTLPDNVIVQMARQEI